MLESYLSSRHAPGQHPTFIFQACRIVGIVAAGLNAYLTLRYAQSVWPDDRVVSTLVALVWEASLICFAVVGMLFLREAAYLRGIAFLTLAGLQMAGSAQVSAGFIDVQSVVEDQAAIALARDHAADLAAIDSLQAQIARTMGPKLLASLRAREESALTLRRTHEADGVLLSRGYGLLNHATTNRKAPSMR